jgi:hypothetical protein
MLTTVENIYKVKESENTVYIGRAGKGRDGYFGNPFSLFAVKNRRDVLRKYRDYFWDRLETDKEFKERVESLRGKVLLCFCKPLLCHGDVIADYLNGEQSDSEFAAEEATWD